LRFKTAHSVHKRVSRKLNFTFSFDEICCSVSQCGSQEAPNNQGTLQQRKHTELEQLLAIGN